MRTCTAAASGFVARLQHAIQMGPSISTLRMALSRGPLRRSVCALRPLPQRLRRAAREDTTAGEGTTETERGAEGRPLKTLRSKLTAKRVAESEGEGTTETETLGAERRLPKRLRSNLVAKRAAAGTTAEGGTGPIVTAVTAAAAARVRCSP